MAAARKPRQTALLLIGSIGPLGYLPASGTVSVAVAGIPLAWLMRTHLTFWVYLIVVAIFTAVAVCVHDEGDRLLKEKDSRKLVWDELAGFFVAVIVIPWTWQMVVLAFLLERLIDIAKVPPANWIEKNLIGGVADVGDDIVAGLYALLILQAVARLVPGLMGIG